METIISFEVKWLYAFIFMMDLLRNTGGITMTNSVNQRIVLAALAYAPTDEPQGQSFSIKTRLAPSNIKRTLDVLIIKDFIFQDKNSFYKALDPAMMIYLRNIPFFNLEK